MRLMYGAGPRQVFKKKKNTAIIISNCAHCCLRAVCLCSVCPAQVSLIIYKNSFFIFSFWGGREERWPQIVSTQGDFCTRAWTRARPATDRDLESAFHQQKGERLEIFTSGSRP